MGTHGPTLNLDAVPPGPPRHAQKMTLPAAILATGSVVVFFGLRHSCPAPSTPRAASGQ